MIECSVVLISYHSKLNEVRCTLESILRQKDIVTELIIADDGSPENHYAYIESYLKKRMYTRYAFVDGKINVGTVRNIYRALKRCAGKYVKVIGAGDMLYNEHTLFDMCKSMTDTDVLGFGLVQDYLYNNGTVTHNVRATPHNIEAYIKEDYSQIIDNLIKYEQYIPGVALIYNREYVLPYFKQMLDKNRYCEDMIESLIILNYQSIRYTNCYAVWYQQGYGISSQGNKKIPDSIVQDQKNMYAITKKYQKGIWNHLGKICIHALHSKRMRTIVKIFFQPGLFFILNKTKKQIKEGYYNIDETGFLDNKEFLNICFKCEA